MWPHTVRQRKPKKQLQAITVKASEMLAYRVRATQQSKPDHI